MRIKNALKKILSVSMVLCMMLTAAQFPVMAATTGTTGACTWTLEGTVLTISGNGKMADYSDYTYISGTLPWGTSITSVVIEHGVENIGKYAFKNCDSLTSVDIPETVTEIGDYAFGGCTSIPSIVVPDGVTRIGWYAFSGCSNLINITIGSGVANILDNAFWKCARLKEINVDEDNQNFSSVDGVLFSKNKTVLKRFPEGKTGNYIIPDGVAELYNWSFRECIHLTSLVIPSSVTYVGVYVFNESANLTDVYYTGNMNDKSKITVQSNNRGWWSAKWHYNTLLVDEHVYTGECATECSVCNYTREVSILHTFDNVCDAECNGCDHTREVPEHVYSNNCDTTCDICGYDRDQGDDGQWSGLLKEGKTYEFVFDIYSDATTFTVSDSNGILTFGEVVTSSESVMVNVTVPLGTAGKITRIDVKGADGILYAQHHISIIESTISHVYDSACDIECNECEEIRTVNNNHVYDNSCDTSCNDCGAIRTVDDHVYYNQYDADCNICGATREVSNPTAPTFVISSTMAKVGDTFTVAVSTKNNSGIVSLKLKVGYDAEVLELVNIEEADFTDTSFGELTKNPITILWEDVLNPDNTTNGTVALLTFKVKATVKPVATEIAVTYDPEDVYNYDWENVEFAVENGTVTIVEYYSGDVNGDGDINNKDLGILRRYLNEWDVTIDELAADVNRDGNVNNKDLGVLRRYLNDWDVELK